jgi:sulfide:quinone oxidoreductase
MNARTPEVVIVGGGVAALEAMMGVRALAGERVNITLVAPDADFVYRPMAVGEPFGHGAPRRYPLSRIAADFAARFTRAKVIAVAAHASGTSSSAPAPRSATTR